MKRGLTEEEGAELLKLLSVQEFGPGQQSCKKARAAARGPRPPRRRARGRGDARRRRARRAWFALSAFPAHLKILGGPEGGVVAT